jgi:cation/acetate symporter
MARLQPPERDIGILRAPIRSTLGVFAVFVLVILVFGLFERLGAQTGFVPRAVIGAALLLSAAIALFAHGRRATDYYVADRRLPAAFSGLAAASAFAGLVAIGLAEGGYASRAEFLASAAGLGLGLPLIAFLFAPGLRRFGVYTTGDFLAARFGGSWVRLTAAIVTFLPALLILLAQLKIVTALLQTLLGLAPRPALYAAAGLTAIAALPGGMRSLSWTQGVQYFVIALACLVPAGFLAAQEGAMDTALSQDFGALMIGNLPAWGVGTLRDFALPAAGLALGAASLPFLVTRGLTATSGREAGASMLWALLLSILLVAAALLLAQLLLAAGGGAANASGAASGDVAQLALLFGTPPVVFAALVMAGLLAALFSVGQAALFSAATAVSHDLWDELIDRRGTEGRRILVARIILIAVAALAAALAAIWPIAPPKLLAWALALAAGGVFAPLLLGLYWQRCNEIGAIAGMVAGFGFAALISGLTEIVNSGRGLEGWTNVGPATVTLIAVAMSFAATVLVSLITPASEPAADDPDAPRRDGLPMRERPA